MLSANDYHFLAKVTDQYSHCDITNIVSAAKYKQDLLGQVSGTAVLDTLAKIQGKDPGSRFRVNIQGQDSGVGFRVRIKGLDPGKGFRVRIQGQELGLGLMDRN